jgi:hypothetical protein
VARRSREAVEEGAGVCAAAETKSPPHSATVSRPARHEAEDGRSVVD